MATATTLTTLRQRLFRELDLGVLIPNGFFDSAAAGSITSSNILRNADWGSNHFNNKSTVIFRPGAASAADMIRYASTLANTTGALSHSGANYSDTTVGSEAVELWFDGIRPDLEILDALNRALEFVDFSTFVGISHGNDLDYDMSIATDTNWSNVGSPSTSAKSTTARRTPYGLRSYQLINNGVANEGTQSATLGAVAGRMVSMFAISSCNVGTASLVPYDVTNSAAFTSAPTVTHSEEEPQIMCQRNLTVPASCTEMAAQLLGTTTTSDIFWNGLWVYKHDNLRVNLPDFINDDFKAPSIFQLRGQYSSAQNIYDAQGVEMVELEEGRHYKYLSHHNDANPHAIMLTPGWNCYEWPLMVQVRRPYSDVDSLSAESDDTKCPLHLYMPMAKKRVIMDVLLPRNPQNTTLAAKLAEAEQEWSKANYVRPVKSVARRPYYGGGAIRRI